MLQARRVLALLVTLAVGAGVAGCGLFGGGGGPQDAADAFATAWSAGDIPAAAAATDNPAEATQVLTDARDALRPVSVRADVTQVRTATERAAASVDVTWDLGQGRVWNYRGEFDLQPAPEARNGWLVRWAPTVVHPQLTTRQKLSLQTDSPPPAPVVDRGGVPLLAATQVINVQLDRRAAGNLPAVAGSLAKALSPIEPLITVASITDGAARTPDGQAYSVAVLRDSDYQRVKPAIYDLPGVRFVSAQRLLAPDAGFARQILPAVRTEMAAQITGVDGWSVRTVDSAGATVTTLTEKPPTPGSTVTLGMDRAVQSAAEDAVEPVAQQTMIVAIAPSSGDLLAVAQNGPADAAGALALTGRYPPGSTFKMATATAAVEGLGLTVDSPVACPGQTVLGGRPVPNEGMFALGTVTLRTAFAKSCNTTFATLGSQLGADALPTAALQLGLGADFTVPGLTTVTGSVPASADLVQRAENGFGQGQVLATPLGMAIMAATVAKGAPVVPELIHGRPTQVTVPATAPNQAALAQLRPMMRAVVTEGTARKLAGRGEVYGKTGTAEFTDDGRSHAWFVGYRGDLAFAVLIVDGGSSSAAVDVADRFLAALR